MGITTYFERQAKQESHIAIKETCPKIDKAFESLIQEIKNVNGDFRELHIEALTRALVAEDKIIELEQKIEQLEDENDNLKNSL